jgi:ApeA N-terminal domain 1
MNQENEIEVLGFWWFLGHSEEKFSGILRYSSKHGATLEVSINENSKLLENWQQKYDIIWGMAENKVYTLYNCRQIGNSLSILQYFKFSSKILFSNSKWYLESREDIKFEELNVQINNTYNFFRGFNSFYVDFEYTENLFINKVIIQNTSKQIDFNINDFFKGNISIGNNYHFGESFEVKSIIWFNIEAKDNILISYQTFEEYMDMLRIFFSIAVQGICVYDEISVGRPDFDSKMRLYVKNTFGEVSKKIMMFDYEEVRVKFPQILENWFILFKEIPEVINLFYNIYTSTQFYEYHFRDTYVALEGLYRWKLKRKTTGNIVPGLLNPLDIRKGFFPTFMKIVENYKIWGEVARKNRVYHTHLNEEIFMNDLVDNAGLLKLMRKMQAIILFYILEELGLSDDEIESSFRKLESYFLPFFF